MDFLFAMFAIFAEFESAPIHRGTSRGPMGTGYGPIGTGYGPIGTGYGPIG